MSGAERAYQLLLRAYPADFRAEYGREMALLFRDQWRSAASNPVRFWAATLWDVVRSAPVLRMETGRGRRERNIQSGEGAIMKMTMAILAIIIGVFEATNAMQEVFIMGIANKQSWPLQGGTIAMVAGLLLVASGIALLRRWSGATMLAQVSAVICLAAFVLTGFVMPLISMFGTLLGVAFPIALFFFARTNRDGGLSDPSIA